MKRGILILLAAAAGFAVAAYLVSNREAARHARLAAEQQSVWEAEKARLEQQLKDARSNARANTVPALSHNALATGSAVPARLTPQEIVARLQALRVAPGADPAAVQRQAIYWFEELAATGPAALGPIREFLVRYEDAELDPAALAGKNVRDRMPMTFVVPPTLRFGFFEVTRRIGGIEAQTILSEALAATGRGAEVAYLARALQGMAPDKYRDQSIGVARTLLAASAPATASSPIDRNHREFLFGVLAFFGDTSYATEATSQLVRTDFQVDRGALKYLQQALGPQAVPIVAQAYDNPGLTNSNAREPLARLALAFVGADAQANVFYQRAINDPALTGNHRRNLIEDLNQDGFADLKNLGPRDLPLIENRINLIEKLAPTAMDPVNAAAFKEAYKDLVNMRERVLHPEMSVH